MVDKKEKTKHLGTRVSHQFYEVIKAYLAKSDCLNESDLIRRALSEYIKREAPELYREIMDLK